MTQLPRTFSSLLLGAALALLSSCAATQFEGGTLKPMQEDFDRIRLDHLLEIDSTLREFVHRKGSLPFASLADAVPVVVVIATDDQHQRNREGLEIRVDRELRAENGVLPPAPSRVQFVTAAAFVDALQEGLGRPISLPIDPQRVPVNKPSVYLLVLYRGVYDVSAYLHHNVEFARELGPYHNKVALANRSLPASGNWRREDLLANSAFREFFRKPFNRGGYTLRTQLPP
jgi:hypothetical protein